MATFTLSSLAHGQAHMNFEQISLSMQDEEGNTRFHIYPNQMIARQSRRAKYVLGVQDGRSLDLSERQFELLSVLFKNRMEWRRADQLNQDLAEQGFTPASEWSADIDSLNAHIAREFGKALILKTGSVGLNETYKIAAGLRVVSQVAPVFNISESREYIRYRGQKIEASPRQFNLIEALDQAPNRELSVGQLRLLLGPKLELSSFLRATEEINAKAFKLTGAILISLKDQVLRLNMSPVLPLPSDLKTYHFADVTMTLGPNQQVVFEALGLHNMPLNSRISINEETYRKIGLPPLAFRTALRALNKKYIDLLGAPVLVLVNFNFVKGQTSVWNGSEFEHGGNLKWAEGICDKYLGMLSEKDN